MIHDVTDMVIYYHETLGIILDYFPDRDTVYLKYIIPRTSFFKIKVWKKKE